MIRGAPECSEPHYDMRNIYKPLCLLLMALILCTVSGCGTIDSLLRYVLSLPMMILNSMPSL